MMMVRCSGVSRQRCIGVVNDERVSREQLIYAGKGLPGGARYRVAIINSQ